MEKKSLIRTAALLLMVLIALVLVMSVILAMTAIREGREARESMTESILEVYAAQLDGELSAVQEVLFNTVNNINSDLFRLESDDEAERYYASVEISDQLEYAIQGGSRIGLILAAEDRHDTILHEFRGNSGFTLAKRQRILAFAQELLDQAVPAYGWRAVILEGDAYLYRCFCSQGHLTAAFIQTDVLVPAMLSDNGDDIAFALLDQSDTALAFSGVDAAVVGEPIPDSARSGRLTRALAIPSTDITLTALATRVNLRKQEAIEVLGIGALLAVLIAFTLLLLRYMTRAVLHPLGDLTKQLEGMKDTEDLHLREEGNSREFSILTGSFNRLMEENVNLRMRSYEKMIAARDMELKCIHLQLRPHFFLNAMTTISSLSISGKNAQIKEYIDALSKNIRYMFKSGMHTVPLSEELTHVRNYFEMQELKYPDTVFYMVDQEPGTDDWPVPQMLIHTVIENEYKHAVCVGRTLTILLGIRLEERDGETFLSIEVEDDGQGYPPEILDRGSVSWRTNGSRVGLGSLFGMLSLMYGREDLLELANAEPHGARTRALIPRTPLSEYQAGENGA